MKQAKVILERDFVIGEVDPRLTGSFVEHLGRCLYGGLYEPEHPSADSKGFRDDVKELITALGVRTIRYPGGNFVSGYNWKDGIGSKALRPHRQEMAWNVIETNEVGTDEFASLMKELDVELIMAVNLGTGTPMEAGELVDYCNTEEGTYWSDLRKANGSEEPYGIKTWCLGNEMDGRWQIHSLTAKEYARKATETAKIMRWMDNDIELIACGSCTNELGHTSYGDWDLQVLEEAYEHINYLSLHRYYNYHQDVQLVYDSHDDESDIPYFFRDLQEYIDTITSVIRFVKGKKQSSHDVYIALDEWGVITSTSATPGGVSQQYGYATFSLFDAVIYGGLLCTLLLNSDKVKIANQSLLVNEGGMISTHTEGVALLQITAYPFRDVALYAKGVSLQPVLESPTVDTHHHGKQPCITLAATYDKEQGSLVVFIANVSVEDDVELTLDLRSFCNIQIQRMQTLYDDNPYVSNSANSTVSVREHVIDEAYHKPWNVVIKRHSWNVLICKEL